MMLPVYFIYTLQNPPWHTRQEPLTSDFYRGNQKEPKILQLVEQVISMKEMGNKAEQPVEYFIEYSFYKPSRNSYKIR